MKHIFILLLAFYIPISLFAQNSIDIFLKADSLTSVEKDKEAEKYLVQLSRENPFNGGYHFSLGEIYHNNDEFRKSITHFRKAQNLGWEYRSNYYMAHNYISIGNQDSAIYYLKKHEITPLNGHPDEKVYEDTIFKSLHTLSAFIDLLPPKIKDTMDVMANWLIDINYLSDELKKTHYNPYFKLEETEWNNRIEQLKNDVPNLNNDQILARIYQFLAEMGDAHTLVRKRGKFSTKRLPFNTKIFSDGCYINHASEEYKELLGARILKVNNTDIDSVINKVCSLIPKENELWYKFIFFVYFRNMNLLHGLEICNTADSLEITYSIDNRIERKTIISVSEQNIPEMISYHSYYKKDYPQFIENSDTAYWYNYAGEDKEILYVQINGIMSLEENPLSEFCDTIESLANNKDISAFVLDLRLNGGGNSSLNKNIIKLLLSDNINIKGKLFVLIGSNTFSAAQNLTSDIEHYTEAIFMGEPTGSSPNFIGEVNPFKLPYSGMQISSSNLYHQRGHYSSDKRKWIAPDIYIDFSFNDYKNGIDPVLNTIIEFTK